METVLPEIPNPLASARIVGENISYEEYSRQIVDRGHPDYRVGRSDLADIWQCPHKWRMGYVSEDTEATDWGRLFEAIVQDPKTAGERFAVQPSTYINEEGEQKPWNNNAKVCKAWRKDQGDKTIIKDETWTQAQNAAKFFFGDGELRKYVRCSKFQVMLEGSYEDNDTELTIPLKGLVDLVPGTVHPAYGKSLGDLKTATNASPFVWGREIQKRALHWQAALYLDLWTKATGEDRMEFRHLISESGPPWQVGRRILSGDYVTLGRMQYLEALKLYAQCLRQDIWPGYERDLAGLVINGWLIVQPEQWMVKEA